MHPNKKILLTFDYELFLGSSSGTIEQSIISPTQKILETFRHHGGKGIFFVDAAMLLHLREINNPGFELIKSQLKQIVLAGHSVELHLHAQWKDANYDPKNNIWSFKSLDHYRIHSLGPSEAEKLICEGKRILEEIIREVVPGYSITCFRAGGWCLQPFVMLQSAFAQNGIKYDFSVVPGFQEKAQVRYFDFSKARKDLSHWKFSSDPCVEDTEGQFTEIPCSVERLSPLSFLMNKLAMKNVERMGNGKGAVEASSSKNKIKKLLKSEFSLNIDFMGSEILQKCIRQSRKELLVVVGHPKILSHEGIRSLEQIVQNFKTLTVNELHEDLRE